MRELENKKIVVAGRTPAGEATLRFLKANGAFVTLSDASELLSQFGAGGKLARNPPELIVVMPKVPAQVLAAARSAGIRVVTELELAFEHASCMSIGVTGTNGKTTTSELIEAILKQAHRKTLRAGANGMPLCTVLEDSRELDYLTLDLDCFDLEHSEHYRPSVGVLLNLTPDHLDYFSRAEDYARTMGRLFASQRIFDWAIVQSEALAQLRSLEVEISAKVISFSAENRRADIYLDRGLLISRLPGWTGPLIDLDECHIKGPHNAENIMAALCVGHVLRLPLEEMVAAVKEYRPGPHRFETVAEINGVTFINDSKAMNVEATRRALLSLQSGKWSEANVWLIAGGRDKGLAYHDLGPLLARRVKHAFLIGEAQKKLQAAWGLFTPCTPVQTLLEAVSKAAADAQAGDVVLLSPACSSFDMFQNYQHRGEMFRQAVEHFRTTSPGVPAPSTTTDGGDEKTLKFAP
ncbi:MAG: UDP-N-acetylmuramoylalanine--D-glutamate ligase [Verrucomicrobiales bacterium]|nr:UDP-N-acetylmuramoylalanine--D-glutamate ligase [Verrucomicrobiales bacterium]